MWDRFLCLTHWNNTVVQTTTLLRSLMFLLSEGVGGRRAQGHPRISQRPPPGSLTWTVRLEPDPSGEMAPVSRTPDSSPVVFI